MDTAIEAQDVGMEVKVLNKNDRKFADMFDGILYEFAPNVPVKIPSAAARHIFGVEFPEDATVCESGNFREEVFLHLQKRWGWNSADAEKLAEARKLFDNIILTPIVMQLVAKEWIEENLLEPRKAANAPKSVKFKERVDGEEIEEEVA